MCASMDIREHPPVRHLTEDYLNDIVKNSQQNMENCELDDGEEKEEFNVFNMNTQSVILAPFGLSAVLTGSKNENSEQYTEKIVEDWNAFYPMKKHENERSTSSKLPKLVEVISGNYIVTSAVHTGIISIDVSNAFISFLFFSFFSLLSY